MYVWWSVFPLSVCIIMTPYWSFCFTFWLPLALLDQISLQVCLGCFLFWLFTLSLSVIWKHHTARFLEVWSDSLLWNSWSIYSHFMLVASEKDSLNFGFALVLLFKSLLDWRNWLLFIFPTPLPWLGNYTLCSSGFVSDPCTLNSSLCTSVFVTKQRPGVISSLQIRPYLAYCSSTLCLSPYC